MSFAGIDKDPGPSAPNYADCICHTCSRGIHHLGIMSHRAAHRRRGENCEITFSGGNTVKYQFEDQ